MSLQRSSVPPGMLGTGPRSSSEPVMTRLSYDSENSFGVAVETTITATVSTGSTVEPRPGQTQARNERKIAENDPAQRPSVPGTSPATFKSEPDYQKSPPANTKRRGLVARKKGSRSEDISKQVNSAVTHAVPSGKVGSGKSRKSCHPDTWSPEQGEPGDSEPFCTELCMESERCSHDSQP